MSIATVAAGINISRWMVAVSVLTGLGLTIYCVLSMKEPKFDFQGFGIGIGALLFGGGGMMYMNPTSPTPPPAIVPVKP